jgi:hypothetical protein
MILAGKKGLPILPEEYPYDLMDNSEQHESLLLQIDNFFFLQEFDEYVREGDRNAIAVLKRYLSERHPSIDASTLPVRLNLLTGLALLTPIFSYASSKLQNKSSPKNLCFIPEFSIENYGIKVTSPESGGNEREVIIGIRNSLAHYTESIEGKLDTPNLTVIWPLVFCSKKSQ